MDQAKSINIKKLVKTYLSVFPSSLEVDGVFLFGSYAKNQVRDDSDVDLVILSKDFEDMPFIKRLEFLSKMRQTKMTQEVPMDIIGYTPEEFANIENESVIMRQAKKEGRMIWQKEVA